MNKDTLGDRIKRYEAVSNNKLTPRMPVFIRVDGKAFHTFTRGLPKPFSEDLMDAMLWSAQQVSKEMQGFKLAYIQSDEATFMLSDTDSFDTMPWFGNEINKIVSIAASSFTAYFNYYWHIRLDYMMPVAMFDARAFNVPEEDAPNVFIWRQRDWERNSVQMFARAYFSHGECENKKIPDLHEMLYTKGQNWAKLPDRQKNGTFITRDGLNFDKHTYESLLQLMEAGCEG